jgi:hypothetical protein
MAFGSLNERTEVTLGELHFRVSALDTIFLPNLIRSTPTDSTRPSVVMEPSSPSSVGSTTQPELTPTSTYCVDAYHVTSPDDIIRDHEDKSLNYKSCTSGMYPICFHCAIIDKIMGVNNGLRATNGNAGQTDNPLTENANDRMLTNISEATWNKARAVIRGTPMGLEATEEETMAYHVLLRRPRAVRPFAAGFQVRSWPSPPI